MAAAGGLALPCRSALDLGGSGSGLAAKQVKAGSVAFLGEADGLWRAKLAACFVRTNRTARWRVLVSRMLLNPVEADKQKEEARLYRRTVYDHEQWRRHRSSTRHARHIFSIASSRVILSLGPAVYSLTLFSAVVAVYNEFVSYKLIPLPEWLPVLHISPLPIQLSAPALALLLVFRTNSAYGRFDEARKIWGSNVNRTRDIARQALSWIDAPEDAGKLKEFLRYLIAYPYCLKDHLVQEDDLRKELAPILQKNELDKLLANFHRPNHAVQMMSDTLAKCHLSDINRSSMDHNLTQFHDNTGACERIFKTPIPVSYTRLTSRFLVLWHIVMPFCLWDSCQLLLIPATFASAAALLCIDEVGVLIEEPFSILALPALCQGMQKGVEGLVMSHADWPSLRSAGERVQSGVQTVNGVK